MIDLEKWKRTTCKIKDMKVYKNNPRTITKEKLSELRESLENIGYVDDIALFKDGTIAGGHARYYVFKADGIKEVPVKRCTVDLSEEEIQETVVRLNKNVAGVWDVGILNKEFKKGDLLDWGFTKEELKMPDIEILPPHERDDHVPELRKDAITKRGDVWVLGDHRVMCGDSTMIDDIEKLMNGEKSDIVFTSAPYNVGKTPNGNKQKYIKDSDDKTQQDYKDFLNNFTTNCLTISDYVFSNIQSLAGNKVALIEHMYDMRDNFADTIIWDKKTAEPAMARKVLNSRFEYIHIFSNEAKRSIGKRDFRGTLSNVFELNSRQGKEFAKIHKATFPVALPEEFILNFTESSCMDPFTGTGTTLIACEKTKRKFFGLELEPHYADVTIKRWQKFTNKEAILESTGESFDSLIRE